jgi:ring-1,2-phenylacetyl-CoA epoxidase subunit PaaD
MTGSDRIPLLPAEEYARRQRRAQSAHPELWQLLDAVKDPEIPVISIWELGVLQDVTLEGERVVVTITPTYSGCPAMDVITEEVGEALRAAGYAEVRVDTCLSPAWSSSWMDAAARERLHDFGIAPPVACSGDRAEAQPACPHCGSSATRRVSEFGSTACKALYQCRDCHEPFDYFKTF